MTPAEHFIEAERLLVRAEECAVASIARQMVVTAQVHATLATVAPMYVYDTGICDPAEIRNALGIHTATTDNRL